MWLHKMALPWIPFSKPWLILAADLCWNRLRETDGLTLSELCEDLDMTRQAVTKHLFILEKSKMVVIVWHGRAKRHYLNPLPIQRICQRWIDKYARHRLQTLRNSKKWLELKNK